MTYHTTTTKKLKTVKKIKSFGHFVRNYRGFHFLVIMQTSLFLPSAAKRQFRTGNVFGLILGFEFLTLGGAGGCCCLTFESGAKLIEKKSSWREGRGLLWLANCFCKVFRR